MALQNILQQQETLFQDLELIIELVHLDMTFEEQSKKNANTILKIRMDKVCIGSHCIIGTTKTWHY